MWFISAIIHVFLMAVVNFTDEHLATDNKLPKKSNIHTKVGSVLIASTLMCFMGAILLGVITRDTTLGSIPMFLAIISAVTMVLYWASYFYLLQVYPVHQVVPLNQISSIWLLVIELLFGGSITIIGLLGIILLIYGAYILDAGTFKWQIPTKLFLIVIPATLTWSITLFLVRKASEFGSPTAIYFWQLIATGIIGLVLLMFVTKYREGFLFRIKHQGKKFLGLSLLNETFSETSYLFSSLAVAVAPVAAYVSAMSGIQGLFIILLMFLFPLSERTKVTKMQLIAAALITVGVFLIERK
jgi:EamA-like transporter family.